MTPPYGDGVGRVLNQAWAYELLQRAAGSNRSHVSFVTEYVKLRPGDRILDVGCGPGHILRALPPDVEYVGIDPDARYIESARAHWSDRGVFHVADGRDSYSSDRPFDIVLAMGVMHHLDHAGCLDLLRSAGTALTPSGRFVTIDPARSAHQAKVAQWLISRDRGRYVRTEDDYAELARGAFESVTSETRTDMLRVPYTHAVLSCSIPIIR